MLRWSEEEARNYFRKRGLNDVRELPKSESRPAKADKYPDELSDQIAMTCLPRPVRELRFHPLRKWRFDLAWEALLFACEVDGAVHRIKERFKADLEKHQAAFFMGWQVLRVSPRQVTSGEALSMIEDALIARSAPRKEP